MKWVGVIVLVVIGVLAAIVAIEYFTVQIHALPSFIPGQQALKYGHYRKRGALAALIAVAAFVVAAILAVRILRSERATAASAGDLLATPSTTPESPTAE
jgi:drug/metabolite transporter (DMT)-like permease